MASLNGNNDGLGLPDAKLIVEGGDRANSWATRGIISNDLDCQMHAY